MEGNLASAASALIGVTWQTDEGRSLIHLAYFVSNWYILISQGMNSIISFIIIIIISFGVWIKQVLKDGWIFFLHKIQSKRELTWNGARGYPGYRFLEWKTNFRSKQSTFRIWNQVPT